MAIQQMNMGIWLLEQVFIQNFGIQKSILVVTDDAILVLKREKAQKVKDIYENLSDKKLT